MSEMKVEFDTTHLVLLLGETCLGGIVGSCSGNLDIEQCYNIAEVSSYRQHSGIYAGGIVGLLDKCRWVKSCYNKGDILAGYAGGIGGYCKSGVIYNCYSTSSTISGSSYAGALVGYDEVVLDYVAWAPVSKLQGVGNIADSEWTEYRIWSVQDMKSNSNLLTWLRNSNGSSDWSQETTINGGLPYLTHCKPEPKP